MATTTVPTTAYARAVPHPPVTSVMALVGLVAAVDVRPAGGPATSRRNPARPGPGRQGG